MSFRLRLRHFCRRSSIITVYLRDAIAPYYDAFERMDVHYCRSRCGRLITLERYVRQALPVAACKFYGPQRLNEITKDF